MCYFRLDKKVLSSPNKSTLIADLINNYAQKKAERVEYYPVSHSASDVHAERNGNLERAKHASDTSDQAIHFATVVVY